MSVLKAKSGHPITAEKWNQVVDLLPGERTGPGSRGLTRLVLCRTTEDIPAAVIDESDTVSTVYSSGAVDTYGLVNNGDGTFAPGKTGKEGIMINASREIISSGTELWAIESWDGVLVSTVWAC